MVTTTLSVLASTVEVDVPPPVEPTSERSTRTLSARNWLG